MNFPYIRNHPNISAPLKVSDWVKRFIPLIPTKTYVLDLACGWGRHARLLASHGCSVLAVDRDQNKLDQLINLPNIEPILLNLEENIMPFSQSSLAGRFFSCIIVTNYLYRPLLPVITQMLAPQGILLYETFAIGNARFGRPSNPDFLLNPGELLTVAAKASLAVIAYEHGQINRSGEPALVQRICAMRLKSIPDLEPPSWLLYP